MKQNVIEDDKLLNGLFLKIMCVNVLIGLVQPLNQFVDSMLTGKGLGLSALAAYSLFLPVSSFVLALSSFFSIGTQITCSHMLGSGRIVETKKLIQTALLSVTVFSCVLAMLLFVFSPMVAVALGASDSVSGQIQGTASYLKGYAPGIPAIFLVCVLMSLLQLEGKRNFAVLLSLCIFVINGVGDLANIYLLKKGLLGMAAATSAANIVVFLILLIYFLTSSKMFSFSLAGFRRKDFISIYKNGLPSLSYFGSLVIRTAFFNMLILMYLNERALAVMAVVNGFTAVVDSAIGGPGDATLLLGGVLFGQNDLRGQRKLLKTALISSATLLFIITVCTCLFAEPLAELFSDNGEPAFIAETARAIRLTSLCYVVDGLACVMKKYIQSVGRSKYTSITNVLCNVVYVGVSAWLLVLFMGADGLYMSYTVCYVLVLITHIIYAFYIAHGCGRSGFDILLFLPAGYEVSNENQRVFTVDDIDGCVFASARMADFCREKGVDKRTTLLLALFIEEITTNAVKHGFVAGKKNKIVVKALFRKDRIVLNCMDNCQLFDPWKYYDSLMDRQENIGGIGIRLVAGLAEKVVYTNSFNLNNVMIEI